MESKLFSVLLMITALVVVGVPLQYWIRRLTDKKIIYLLLLIGLVLAFVSIQFIDIEIPLADSSYRDSELPAPTWVALIACIFRYMWILIFVAGVQMLSENRRSNRSDEMK